MARHANTVSSALRVCGRRTKVVVISEWLALRYGFVSDAEEAGRTIVSNSPPVYRYVTVWETHIVGVFFERWKAHPTHCAYWERFWNLLRAVAATDSVP